MSAPVQAPSASLYVGDLSKDSKVNEMLLNNIFQTIGAISSIKLCRDAQTKRSLGYAYVNFHRAEDAERAIATKNFTKIAGKPCRIMWCQRDPKLRRSGKGNIYIKNLPAGFDDEQLFKMFQAHGKILSSKVAQKEGKLLDYGFVHFQEEKAATNAIAQENDREINGQKIVVQEFKSKVERGGDAATTNIYVKGFPKDKSEFGEKELKELFAEYGEITSAKVVLDEENKENKGFAFVNFATKEAAAAACEALHEKKYGTTELVLYVQPHQSSSIRKQFLKTKYEQINRTKFANTNLFIKNLGDQVDDDQLLQMFAPYGKIKSGKIMVDENKRPKGFGFVNFENPEDANKAVIEMNNKMHNGKPLYVAIAQTAEERKERIQQSLHDRQMKAQQMHMFPNQAQMYYSQGQMPQQQRVMYNQQVMMQQRQAPQRFYANQPRMMAQPIYNMMPAGGRGGPNVRGRGANRKGGRGGRGAQGYKLTPNARNMHQPQVVQPQQVMQQPMPQQVDFEAQLQQADPEKQKQILGERIYPEVKNKVGETLAGKITGMLLEMDVTDLLPLLKSQEALSERIAEAREVLDNAQAESQAV